MVVVNRVVEPRLGQALEKSPPPEIRSVSQELLMILNF